MLILGNGRMITRDADNPYLECGAVVIDGDKNREGWYAFGSEGGVSGCGVLDAKGKVIMPALSMHTNIFTVHSQEDCPSKDMTQKDF